MLSNWLKEDLEHLLKMKDRVVVLDPTGEYEWLMPHVMVNAEFFQVSDTISDLETKYLIELNHSVDKVLIYSLIDPTKEKNKWQYMVQEYICNGMAFQKKISRYINEKSGLKETQHHLTKEELLLAGQMSLKPQHNNKEYWERLRHQGRKAILGDLEKEVLCFLHDPESYISSLPDKGREVFYQLVEELLSFEVEQDMDPKVLTDELSSSIFKDLICNKEKTRSIYLQWLDSHTYRESLVSYLDAYEMPQDISIWDVDPNHPFKQIDREWLSQICSKAFQGEEVPDFILSNIKKRIKEKEGLELAKSHYWEAVYHLITFKTTPSHQIEDLSMFIEIYRKDLYLLERCMREIYQHFLDQKDLLNQFKILYWNTMQPYMERWFQLFSSYRENQTGYLYQEIFTKSQGVPAVIIGDAISYEIASAIIDPFSKRSNHKATLSIFQGNYPTTTSNNMSSLFGSPYSEKRRDREKALEDKLGTKLTIQELHESGHLEAEGPTIIYGSDIDAISEKGAEAALKYYQTFIEAVQEKIKQLLDVGFAEVHLVTDHGFVFNFAVDDSEKYASPVEGAIRERYILSDEKKETDDFIVKEIRGEYKYSYFPKGINPIRSKGQYGFSHGGIAPQEILLPHVIIKRESQSQLMVNITNKDKLKEISSNNITIKLQSEDAMDLFKSSRDIAVKFAGDKETISKDITMGPRETREFPITVSSSKFTITIVDAVTKERLDEVKGEKLILRGGLDGFDIH